MYYYECPAIRLSSERCFFLLSTLHYPIIRSNFWLRVHLKILFFFDLILQDTSTLHWWSSTRFISSSNKLKIFSMMSLLITDFILLIGVTMKVLLIVWIDPVIFETPYAIIRGVRDFIWNLFWTCGPSNRTECFLRSQMRDDYKENFILQQILL